MKQLDFDYFNAVVNKFAAVLEKNIEDSKTAQFNCILEECRELQAAYRERNEILILDGVVDVVWTGFVYARMNQSILDSSCFINPMPIILDPVIDNGLDILRQYNFDTFIGSNQENDMCGILGFKQIKSLALLDNLVTHAIKLGRTYDNFDLDGALIALAKENESKLNYPEEQKNSVFRDNKLQKKDEAGNLYSWYRPANFNEYIFN